MSSVSGSAQERSAAYRRTCGYVPSRTRADDPRNRWSVGMYAQP